MQMQTKGVQSIAGEGLVKLAKWTATKHRNYRAFLARIHKFIAGMTIIEKEAREKAAKVEKALIGYDPDKWIKSEGAIRKEAQAALSTRSSTYRQRLKEDTSTHIATDYTSKSINFWQ